MALPIILEGQNQVYKFKLTFSVLVKLRDEGIDFLDGTAWSSMQDEVKNIVPVIKHGIEYAEKRELGDDELTRVVDDLMEDLGFQGIYSKIMEAISIKGAYAIDDIEPEVEEEEEEEGKNQ